MKIKEVIDKMVGNVFKDYIRAKLDGIIEKWIDKISTAISGILGLIFFAGSVFLFFIFITISLAFFLSELLGKNYWGFTLISVLYLFIGVIFWRFRDIFFKKPIAKVFQKAFKNEGANESH